MDFDVRNALVTYMPSLLELLGDQKISWTSINKGLTLHLEKIRNQHISTQTIVESEATFYSIIIDHHFGKGDSSGMFSFYDATFKSLSLILSTEEKKVIHRMLSKVLNNLTKDYINFIGELACLNKLMLTGEYNLINIEEVIHIERLVTADIFLKRKNDGLEILIEVLNLHIENRDFQTYQELRSHLSSKFLRKVQEKIINPDRLTLIQPVVWTNGLSQIGQLSNFYQNENFQINNVLPPMIYATWKYLDGSYEHRFESVRTILNEY